VSRIAALTPSLGTTWVEFGFASRVGAHLTIFTYGVARIGPHDRIAHVPEQAATTREMSEPAPYLSAVVTSRNDDHGGNLLSRMQVFTGAFIEQCKRHALAAKLIVVEWNPPPDRPSLADALRWPQDFGPCRVRLIRVAPEIHRRLRHAEALPLFQMIAKNAGIPTSNP